MPEGGDSSGCPPGFLLRRRPPRPGGLPLRSHTVSAGRHRRPGGRYGARRVHTTVLHGPAVATFPTAVGDPSMDLGGLPAGLLPVVRALGLAGQLPLRLHEPGPVTVLMPRVGDLLPRGQSTLLAEPGACAFLQRPVADKADTAERTRRLRRLPVRRMEAVPEGPLHQPRHAPHSVSSRASHGCRPVVGTRRIARTAIQISLPCSAGVPLLPGPNPGASTEASR